MSTRYLAGLMIATAWVAPAAAADPDTIELFGQVYKVQRFDYYDEVKFDDPADPNFEIALVEAEAAHYLGNNQLLLGSDEMDAFLSYRDHVVKVQLDTDATGMITGLSYIEHVLVLDFTGPGSRVIGPAGVTVNTGTVGLAAGGDLLVGGNDAENVYGTRTDPNDPLDPNAAYLGEFPIMPHNINIEDLCWVPDANDPNTGEIWTVEDDNYQIDIFDPNGVWLRNFLIAGSGDPNTTGEGKGVTYLPDVITYPSMFQGLGGVVMVSLDDEGPGLQVFDRDGTQIALEPLTDDGTSSGNPLLDPGAQSLQLESIATDPMTGRLILVQQGHWDEDIDDTNYLWILSPIRSLDLSLVNPDYGTVAISPDPNDANAPAYPAGTIVTMTAEPNETRSFHKWVVYDPNFPGDANYATEDSNTVIEITLNADMQVEAHFKCGSGVEVMLPCMLVGLFVCSFVASRRLRERR